ncbi:hypothetical protein D3877_29135 [Azospirillum cavernae]|uniref:Uncharacterized protein n=1 Tax=Azospirillum cavernae TaxID=2320860 RepID=A0A418VK20_9PROT|nr:hypothetical protein [Azospirillum cavernae]RJF76451.1 hypothetical protein D3877_29135 [Azospirillum cavernae]
MPIRYFPPPNDSDCDDDFEYIPHLEDQENGPILIVSQYQNNFGRGVRGWVKTFSNWDEAGGSLSEDIYVSRFQETAESLLEIWGDEESIPVEALAIVRAHGKVMAWQAVGISDDVEYFAPEEQPSAERFIRRNFEGLVPELDAILTFLQGRTQIREWIGTPEDWSRLEEDVAMAAYEAGYDIADLLDDVER